MFSFEVLLYNVLSHQYWANSSIAFNSCANMVQSPFKISNKPIYFFVPRSRSLNLSTISSRKIAYTLSTPMSIKLTILSWRPFRKVCQCAMYNAQWNRQLVTLVKRFANYHGLM